MQTESKHLLKILFNSLTRTHQLSARIIDPQTRRNQIKRLQGNYRRFQNQIDHTYKSNQDIDVGLLRYHHHQTELQYLNILYNNIQLGSRSLKLNPFPRRYQNFDLNRDNHQKIDMSQFFKQS